MLHPQHFASGLDHNEELYQQYYISLLDQLKEAGVSFAKFNDFDHVVSE